MASLNGSRSNSPTHPSDFDFDSTFTEISILIAHAEQYAKGFNLIVRNHPKSSFTAKDWPFSEPFPDVKVPHKNSKLIEPVKQDVAEEMDDCQRNVDLVQLIINKIIGLVC